MVKSLNTVFQDRKKQLVGDPSFLGSQYEVRSFLYNLL